MKTELNLISKKIAKKKVGSPRKAGINDQQRLFCQKYILCFNGARAARQAGYSDNSAPVIACELLARPHVQAEIARLRADTGAHFAALRDRVIEETALHAFSNTGDMYTYDERGAKLKPASEIDTRLIKGIYSKCRTRTTTNGEVKIDVDLAELKLDTYDKDKSLDRLARMLGLEKADAPTVKVETNLIILPANGKESARVIAAASKKQKE